MPPDIAKCPREGGEGMATLTPSLRTTALGKADLITSTLFLTIKTHAFSSLGFILRAHGRVPGSTTVSPYGSKMVITVPALSASHPTVQEERGGLLDHSHRTKTVSSRTESPACVSSPLPAQIGYVPRASPCGKKDRIR